MVLNNPLFVARNSRSGYVIRQSLRWTGTSGDDYFSFTPSTTGNRRKFTFSVWVKRGDVSGSEKRLFSAASGTEGSPARTEFGFTTGNRIIDGYNPSGSTWYTSTSPSVFRDASAWYHIVLAVDTDQSTDTNRQKIWINGVFMSGRNSFSAVPQNSDLPFNTSGQPMRIGDYAAAAGGQNPFSGHMAELHYFDGTQITSPEDAGLGEFDDSGVWRPIKYTGGNYGTNGCYLKFNPSATNGLGHDYSGNGNNWTAGSGFATSGTGTDVMDDTPTTNWCTLNPVDAGQTLTEGNLKCGSSNSHKASRATFGMTTGKWYWECDAGSGWDNNPAIGIIKPDAILDNQLNASGSRWFRFDGDRWYDGTEGSAYGTAVTSGSGSIIGMAYDGDNGTLTVYVNGTSQGTAFTGLKTGQTPNLGSSTSDVWIPATKTYSGSFNVNFGQRAFAYTPPSGFSALNTRTLPAPSIKDGSDYFQTVLYTGNNSSNKITVADNSGNTWGPDFVWIKPRNNEDHHRLSDIVRGTLKSLASNLSNAESSITSYLGSFDSDGFTISSNSDGGWNNSSYNYVSWNWDAGGTGSSNTDGSITSTVSANPTAGFSIVTYTGNNSSSATVGHGLNATPAMIILKARAGTNASNNWYVWHQSLSANRNLNLNTTIYERGTDYFSSGIIAAPSNTTNFGFTAGSNLLNVNENNTTYVAYCFAEIEGYSKFGRYTGNGTTTGDGPFVWCGFKPAFIVMKSSSASTSDNWRMYDNKRLGYNADASVLYPNLINQESVSDHVDILSNGFKLRSNNNNSSGVTYIFFAFASNPFGGNGVSPATAR